jgi:hypothetical protein
LIGSLQAGWVSKIQRLPRWQRVAAAALILFVLSGIAVYFAYNVFLETAAQDDYYY